MIVSPRGSHEELRIETEAEYEREVESKRCPTCHGNDHLRKPDLIGGTFLVPCPDCSQRNPCRQPTNS